jgi:peroxiredoxin
LLALIFFILSNPVENITTDPYRIFYLSDSVLTCISNIEYSFSFCGTGALSNIIPEVLGRTHLGTAPGVSHPLMELTYNEITGSGSTGGFSVPSAYCATADSLYYINHDNKVVYKSAFNSDTQGIFNFPAASLLMEYVIPHPFSDELDSDSIAVLSPGESGGVPCFVFHVFYKEPEGSEAIWFIGIADFLPRAVERIDYYGETAIPGGQLLEISDISYPDELPAVPAVPADYGSVSLGIPLKPGDPAPEFFLADMDGFTLRPSNFPDRNLVLCFFSSRDPSSLSTLGAMNSLALEYGNSLQVLGISILEKTDTRFRLESLQIQFPVLVFGEAAAEAYRVSSVPAVFLVSTDRQILYSSSGFADNEEAEIRRIIESRI